MAKKYDPLLTYLLSQKESDSFVLTFEQIEKIIGKRLPKSATEYREWWSNQRNYTNRPQAEAWMSIGVRVDEVNQKQKWVKFKKYRGE